MKSVAFVSITLAGAFLVPPESYACSVSHVVTGTELVNSADVIVRAVALEYAVFPSDPTRITTGVPDSKIRFRILETLRGVEMPELVLPGYLVDRNDYNDRPAPYDFVRPNGRRGSCFANSYRTDAQFVLLLKKDKSGDFTVNWSALSPVNEQLHSENDPSLLWIREQTRKP